MNDCTIILLGATGDLARRKIIPALYGLMQQGYLASCAIIGVSQDALTPQQMYENARPFIEYVQPDVLKKLEGISSYQKVNLTDLNDVKKLQELVVSVEKKRGLRGNRLVYCATSPDLFCAVTRNLSESGVLRKGATQDPYHRIVYEKPFGSDHDSALQINKCVASCLDESQIYRVDHYLSKELVGNIAAVRFANSIFEPLWNRTAIESVHIVLSESVGLEGRGAYYDRYGVLKDVVQNHMLQLLALVAMETPTELSGGPMRIQKAHVLKQTHVVGGMLGQYEGYQQEPKVAQNSTTPTFAFLEFAIDNDRWKGVPFYFTTGKRMDKKETYIAVKFRTVVCALKESASCDPNYLIIRIAPEGGFSLRLNAKKPGLRYEITPVAMDFCYSCVFPDTPQDYQNMLQEVMAGEESIAVRFDLIESSWLITDAIERMQLPLYTYGQGSKGPEKALAAARQKGILV